MDGHDDRFDDAVAGWADEVRRSATRDDGAWRRQREAIGSRLEARRVWRPSWTWAVVAVSTAAVIAGFWVALDPGAHGPTTPQVTQVDPDDELIAEVESAVARDMPSAFEPADPQFW